MIYSDLKERLMVMAMGLGIPEGMAGYAADAIFFLLALLMAWTAFTFARRMGLRAVKVFVEKSPSRWDDVLDEKGFFSRIAHLIPALIIYSLAPLIMGDFPSIVSSLQAGAKLYAIIMIALAAYSAIDTFHDIYRTTRFASKFAIKGMLQALKLVIFFIGLLLVLSTLTDRTPIYFLSGLGALTAVLLLVFKDTLMGLVAGIQISANEMVHEGDWIEMPQFGADGDVMDVSLTTVKVQNFDKTITTIPTYALISQSFKNWRGMEESGGRRIKRSILIDMSSIGFCDDELLSRLSKVKLISGYITERSKEIAAYNEQTGCSPQQSPLNGRRMTNIGTFRRYVEEYLRNHPGIHTGMTFLVRQLAPTEKGLPIEIYVFTNDKRWVQYEAVQADIFDHLLSAVPQFDLRVFQNPAGSDLSGLLNR